MDGQHLHRKALANAQVQEIYLHELETGSQACQVIGQWVGRYNDERPHSSHDDETPTETYFELELGSSLGGRPGKNGQGRATRNDRWIPP